MELHSNPSSYNVLNFPEVLNDIQNRNKIISDFRSLLAQRIQIEKQYAEKLNLLANIVVEAKAIENPQSSTEYFFNSFILTLKNQSENAQKYMKKLKKEILFEMDKKLKVVNEEIKKQQIVARSLTKDYEVHKQSTQKLGGKYLKKSIQLKKTIESFVIGMVGEVSFDKKNQCFIKINSDWQKQYSELFDNYYKNTKKFNEDAETYGVKLAVITQKLSNLQAQKSQIIKQSYMNLQLERSNYGATMVKDNNYLIQQIYQLAQKCPDVVHDGHQEQLIKNFLLNVADPCGYLIRLFNSLKNDKTQVLILYGQSPQHKKYINESFGLNLSVSDEKCKISQIAKIFQAAFQNQNQFTKDKFKRLKNLLEEGPQLRKNFILCLQKYRRNHQFQMKEESLKKIQEVLNLFLDICYRQKDTYNSKLLMVLSFTYYTIANEKRKDLAQSIKHHEIWKEQQWWECAILQSIYEETQIKVKKSSQIVINIWDIKGSGKKQTEGESTFQMVVFNQLIYYLHNMKLFQLPIQMIAAIGRKYSKIFGLNKKMIAEVQNYYEGLEDGSSDTSGSSPQRIGLFNFKRD